MSSEWQSVGFENICAVLAAAVFVAQCVAQEISGAEQAKARVTQKARIPAKPRANPE